MNADSTVTYSVGRILFKYDYFAVMFSYSLEMKNWENENWVRKSTRKRDTTNDSCCVYSYFVDANVIV